MKTVLNWIDEHCFGWPCQEMHATAIRQAPNGFERIDGFTSINRHRHSAGYAAVVVAGAYRESGDGGRFRVTEGDVLVHAPFEAHRDEIAEAGAVILNLPCPQALFAAPAWQVRDLAALVNLAAQDQRQAQLMLAESASAGVLPENDWPDLLADDLRTLRPFRLRDWAKSHGLAPETVARGFSRVYGVPPHSYRAESRARAAIRDITSTALSLAAIATRLGFSDQSHMTRAVREISGRTPGNLRRAESVGACRSTTVSI